MGLWLWEDNKLAFSIIPLLLSIVVGVLMSAADRVEYKDSIKNAMIFNMLGRTGFEPVTNGLKGHCSTNWANAPNLLNFFKCS